MYHNIHSDFILAPILEVFAAGVNACQGIGDGIETQPLSEYVLSSLFLKATGAQEQKLKCICWEIATHDYDFRYQFIRGDFQLGECSDYKSKNKICSYLQEQIRKLKKEERYTISEDTRKSIIVQAISGIKTLFENTNISIWGARDFAMYKDCVKNRLKLTQILSHRPNGKHSLSLFESTLQKDYDEIVHRHRNRLAHNTASYQRHLPTLETLAAKESERYNYFYRYTLLVLIDLILIHLYREYRENLMSYSVHP